MKITKASKEIKASKRVQDWVKEQESIKADSMFGVEDGFFTRDDCIEYIEIPLEDRIREERSYGFQQDDPINLRAYIEDGNVIEVDCDVDDFFFTIKAQIDMRKIKKPSDLKKYVTELFWEFDEKYCSYVEDTEVIENCDKVTASNIINTNNGDYEITPHGKGFLVDQIEGEEMYFDTYDEALAAIMEDAGQAVDASTDIAASKTLCVQHGDTIERYKFARVDGQGDEYTGDNWFESYIVTPQGELLTWTLNGNYIPSAREFWIEADQDINCTTETDREFKAVPLKSLKKGAWFTIKPIAEPKESQVWVKGDYDKSTKKFDCYRWDDINNYKEISGDKLVYDDNNFEF